MIALLKRHTPFLALVATIALILVLGISRELFWDWDECLYAQYCREMGSSSHYLTNIWNQYIDLQKPPLYTWILRLAYSAENTEFRLRLVNVGASLIILTTIYALCVRYFSRLTGIFAILLLMATDVYVVYSTHLSTDVVFTAFLLLGVFAYIEGMFYASGGKRTILSLLAGVFIGLAAMTKGLSIVSFVAALFVASVLFPSRARIALTVQMGITILLVSVPWHILTFLTYGERFIKVYILDNIIKRAQYPIENHRERWWFYGLLILREFAPWIAGAIAFPAAFVISTQQELKKSKNKSHPWRTLYQLLTTHRVIVIIALLIIIPLISLTRVKTKLAWYTFPVYPFIAIFLSYCLLLVIQFIHLKWKRAHGSNAGLLLSALVTLALIVDASLLIMKQTKIFEPAQDIGYRNQAALAVQKTNYRKLTYLVAFGERQGRLYTPVEETIDMTWVYGGNPCMVYYGGKKTDYIYTTDEFEQLLKTRRGLFLVENGDKKYSDGHKILYTNSEYTLFVSN